MFNFLSKNIFKKHFQIKFESTIWKILPAQSDFLICETRDIERKIIKYHNVDLKSGQFKWHNVSFNNDWWTGIEGIFHDVIIFHKYTRPDLPLHKAIIAVDVHTNSIIWQNPDYKFLTVKDPYLIVSIDANGSQKYLQVEIKTGNIIQEILQEEISVYTQNINTKSLDVLYPEPVFIENIVDPVLMKYFSKIKYPLHDEIEIIHLNDIRIIGYSMISTHNDEITYDDFISVIDNQSRELSKQKLISDASQIVVPRFIYTKGNLIYIQDKSILNICEPYENLH